MESRGDLSLEALASQRPGPLRCVVDRRQGFIIESVTEKCGIGISPLGLRWSQRDINWMRGEQRVGPAEGVVMVA